LEIKEMQFNLNTLIVGAGIAGIQAALDIADSEHKVYLVEREPSIGGHMIQLDTTFPTLDCSECILLPKMTLVSSHPYIELITYSEVEEVSGYIGNFKVKIKKKARYVDENKCMGCPTCTEYCPIKIPDAHNENLTTTKCIYIPFPQAVPNVAIVDPAYCLFLLRRECQICVPVCKNKAIDFKQVDHFVEVEVGSIIIATGYDPFDARLKPEYGYGIYPNVITSLELERLLSPPDPTQGLIQIDGRVPKNVVFIHCVGSRDKTVGNEYCSRVCCMYTAKHAHFIKERIPDAKVSVFYIDMRAFGKGSEQFYERVQKEGVFYHRGSVSEIYKKGDKLVVRAEDTLSGELIEEEADLVVLATGLVPRKDATQMMRIFNISPDSDGFFLERHIKLDPIATLTDGVFIAGCCQGPKDIPDTVAQASAAAARALVMISKGKVDIEAATAVIDEELCSGCKICNPLCPYDAISFDEEKKVSRINEALCKGCGVCVAACPSAAITGKHFTTEQIIAEIEGVLV
jgi:heterodisulfide reductase subunit A